MSKAAEQLLKKAICNKVDPTDNTEIPPNLRCGNSQGCFHLPSFTAIEKIITSCEPWPWSTDRFTVAVVDKSNTTVDHLSREWPTCIIGSRDYCHAPLGVSSFSFSIQNVWEMTTVVYKIACHSCTACPPAIVLRLSIADTIISATVYSQCIKSSLYAAKTQRIPLP